MWIYKMERIVIYFVCQNNVLSFKYRFYITVMELVMLYYGSGCWLKKKKKNF